LEDPRKGFDLLREAWRSARRHGVTLALFGRHGENRPGERYLGNLTTDEEMVAAYRAADLYVHPARMENAPCTIQESLACGTPVLAFAVGGIPEMVISGKTGFLAQQVGADCLQEALDNALSDGNRLSNMRKECRDWAEKIWNPKNFKGHVAPHEFMEAVSLASNMRFKRDDRPLSDKTQKALDGGFGG
jgi:glycosyltransferase involved in cell wall biosynthesis